MAEDPRREGGVTMDDLTRPGEVRRTLSESQRATVTRLAGAQQIDAYEIGQLRGLRHATSDPEEIARVDEALRRHDPRAPASHQQRAQSPDYERGVQDGLGIAEKVLERMAGQA